MTSLRQDKSKLEGCMLCLALASSASEMTHFMSKTKAQMVMGRSSGGSSKSLFIHFGTAAICN